MIYYVIFMTGFAGFLLGLLCKSNIKGKAQNKKCSKNCEVKKCKIDKTYGNFLEYDGSEKA